MKRREKGFTIVELVIVIAVIAILAAVLIPSFSGIIQKAKDSATLQEERNNRMQLVLDGILGQESTEDLSESEQEESYASLDPHAVYLRRNGLESAKPAVTVKDLEQLSAEGFTGSYNQLYFIADLPEKTALKLGYSFNDELIINLEGHKAAFSDVSALSGSSATFLKFYGNNNNTSRLSLGNVSLAPKVILAGNGLEVVISGDFAAPRLEIESGVKVSVSGGVFLCNTITSASTQSGVTIGNQLTITGGEFGFDPTAWVPEGYSVSHEGDVWRVGGE